MAALVEASCQVQTHEIECFYETGWATTSRCDTLIGTGLNSFLYVLFLCLESIMCFSFLQKKSMRDVSHSNV